MPGQTSRTAFTSAWRVRDSPSSFNGGPGNCPAKLRSRSTPRRGRLGFNGGPGNCPAKPKPMVGLRDPPDRASMEGRAIARPNTAGRQHRPDTAAATRASMEGRAIARPNLKAIGTPVASSVTSRFNGGPGNCPAKRRDRDGWPTSHRRASFNGGPGNCPAKRARGASMEGRAIARPPAPSPDTFCSLQWRAGQLPGQTRRQPPNQVNVLPNASMEGRAIARPNRPRPSSRIGRV